MKTSKPISTVGWNSPIFLREKLNELLKAGVISWWIFIYHKGEPNDMGGGKNHYHMYCTPTKLIQTDDIKKMISCEPDPNNDKPLGCLDFRTSTFSHWFWYSIHDERYLKMQHKERKYHYKVDDFITSDKRQFDYELSVIGGVEYQDTRMAILKQSVIQGRDFSDLVYDGSIPSGSVFVYERVFNLLQEADSRKRAKAREEKSKDRDLPFDGEISTGKLKFPPEAPF